MRDYLNDVFGERGLFAEHLAAYEQRDGQVKLARAVDNAMRDGRHVFGEGPCGTGKGIAYGVPAIWHAHHRMKRVLVATATIALQEQFVTQDLPRLAKVLPWQFSFALLKGRNNYLCLDRVADNEVRGVFKALEHEEVGPQIRALRSWATETTNGDVSEVSFIPQPLAWSHFSVSADECKAERCKFFDNCFAEKAKAAAYQADVVVTNYHLLVAHLEVRRHNARTLVLPPFDFLVLDEAHKLADITRDFLGFTVSEHTIIRLAHAAKRFGDNELGSRLRREAKSFFTALADYARSPKYRCRLRSSELETPTKLLSALAELRRLAMSIAVDDTVGHDENVTAGLIREQSRVATRRIEEMTTTADASKVYFIELDEKNGSAKLGAKLIDVADFLHDELFAKTKSVTMVSATLTTNGSFDFLRSEIGAPDDVVECVVESPFDFQKQALLVVPDGLPDPRTPEFAAALVDAVKDVIDRCKGRTLGLFTSYKNLNAVYDSIASNGHRVLRQGDLPRAELSRIFKLDVSSVLLGTDSFWTGIDVPGEALTAVVIDKLPFPNLSSPLVDAICARDPQSSFDNYLLPRAILMLRQGVGRLIRSRKDIGVVVILDRRIADKRYGAKFLASLPPMLSTRRLDNIPRFLAEAAAP